MGTGLTYTTLNPAGAPVDLQAGSGIYLLLAWYILQFYDTRQLRCHFAYLNFDCLGVPLLFQGGHFASAGSSCRPAGGPGQTGIWTSAGA